MGKSTILFSKLLAKVKMIKGRGGIASPLIIFILIASITYSQDTTLVSLLKVDFDLFISIKPGYEISNLHFWFMDQIRYYDRRAYIYRMSSWVKLQGFIIHDYDFGVIYRNFSFKIGYKTTYLNPDKVEGIYKDENSVDIASLKKSISSSNYDLAYKFSDVLSISIKYTNLNSRIDGVEIKPNYRGTGYIFGNYTVRNIYLGGLLSFKFDDFQIDQEIAVSPIGKLTYKFEVMDTVIFSPSIISFILKQFTGSGNNLRSFKYIFQLNYKFTRSLNLGLGFEFVYFKDRFYLTEKNYCFRIVALWIF